MGTKSSKICQIEKCTLWKTDRSPSCRTVLTVIDKLNLNIREIELNMDRSEHRCPEICELNPFATLPILKDGNVVLCDSHAIIGYFAGRYCRDGSLMPKDPAGQALVEQAMFYHSGVLHPLYQAAVNPILYCGQNGLYPSHICDIQRCYTDLDCMLGCRQYFAGIRPTLADISLAPCLNTFDILMTIDHSRYPCLSAWLHRMSQEQYYYTGNKRGLEEFTSRIENGPTDEVNSCIETSNIRRRQAVRTAIKNKILVP